MHYLRILDRGTDIYVAVFRLEPKTERDRKLMDRNGWGQEPGTNYLFLMKIAGSDVEVNWDPYEWHGSRTMRVAHNYLQDVWRQLGWDHLTTLEVVDVQLILKERNSEAANQCE